jgi:membrane-associated phospholipid phosphatase
VRTDRDPAPPLPAFVMDLRALDHAVYAAVASTDTPTLDLPLRRLSQAADRSLIWWSTSAFLAVFGGAGGRRAARAGAASLLATSAVINLGLKPLGRHRPNRDRANVPQQRHVKMPTSASFPSGHSAAAFAFTNAVGTELPALALPLRLVALLIAYSRVHAGVHYPSDTLIGGIVGGATGQVVASLLHRRHYRPRKKAYPRRSPSSSP